MLRILPKPQRLEEKEGTVIYGVGNIAGPGHRIMEIVREEGTQDVP